MNNEDLILQLIETLRDETRTGFERVEKAMAKQRDDGEQVEQRVNDLEHSRTRLYALAPVASAVAVGLWELAKSVFKFDASK